MIIGYQTVYQGVRAFTEGHHEGLGERAEGAEARPPPGDAEEALGRLCVQPQTAGGQRRRHDQESVGRRGAEGVLTFRGPRASFRGKYDICLYLFARVRKSGNQETYDTNSHVIRDCGDTSVTVKI